MNTIFTMSQGAGQKLEFAFQRNDGTASDLDWLSTGENLKFVMSLARGEAELVVKQKNTHVCSGKTQNQVDFWVLFYKQHFNIDLVATDIKLPNRRDGFNWLVIVAKGVTLNQVWVVCKKHFPCWNYAQKDDVESLMQESERGEAKATQVFWFRDRVEADQETKNLSANQQTEQSITLIARCLLELKYFTETNGKHLDIDSITLCAGSRYADGGVPGAGWSGVGSFGVCWGSVGGRYGRLRSRVAVGG